MKSYRCTLIVDVKDGDFVQCPFEAMAGWYVCVKHASRKQDFGPRR